MSGTTPSQIAWSLAILYEHEAEAFDRDLPGRLSPHGGTWIPSPGDPMRASREYARELWRRVLRLAVTRGVDPRTLRHGVNGRRTAPRLFEVEAARRLLGVRSLGTHVRPPRARG